MAHYSKQVNNIVMNNNINEVTSDSTIRGENFNSSIEDNLINDLPDDCLTEIFRWLPVYQRIEIEQVCRRWEAVSQADWRDVKHLHFTRYTTRTIDSSTFLAVQRNPRLIGDILARSGEFLRELKISTPCPPEILANISSWCPNVNKLYIDAANIQCKTTNCREKFCLCNIDLDLRKFRKMQSLSLIDFPLTGKMMWAIFGSNKVLTHLSLLHCIVEKAQILLVARLSNLESLEVTHSDIDDSWLADLTETCRKITHLDISYSRRITDKGISHLKNLKNLERLSIVFNMNISDTSLMALTNLRVLNCGKCPEIRDGGIIYLIRHARNLLWLNLARTSITVGTVAEAEAKWKSLKNDQSEFKVTVSKAIGWASPEIRKLPFLHYS